MNNYWSDIDSSLNELKENGFVKLPSIKNLNLNQLAKNINNEMNGATFAELGKHHKLFLKSIDIENKLLPKLYNLAREEYGYTGDINNQYHIARRVDPGNSKEMYRAHFDSHLFTIVFPINIPKALNHGSTGDLIFFPNARKNPKNEVSNLKDKILFKRYATRNGITKFSRKQNKHIDNFSDFCPLLFIGNTTLHTNKQVTSDCDSFRLTLLAHFFDPSPKFSSGRLIRFLRSR